MGCRSCRITRSNKADRSCAMYWSSVIDPGIDLGSSSKYAVGSDESAGGENAPLPHPNRGMGRACGRSAVTVPAEWPLMLVEIFVASDGAILMTSVLGVPKSCVKAFFAQVAYAYQFEE